MKAQITGNKFSPFMEQAFFAFSFGKIMFLDVKSFKPVIIYQVHGKIMDSSKLLDLITKYAFQRMTLGQ